MDSEELEKEKVYISVKIIEHVPHAIVSKSIMKKMTGDVTVSSFDEGEKLEEKTSPFDIFVQIIEGAAEIMIKGKNHKLIIGQGIVIPAHATHIFNAKQKFKMISTIIKSAYEG